MMKDGKVITLILFLFAHTFVFGQISLTGIVFDYKTKEPVMYVNLGIPEKGIGTVTRPNGTFEIVIPEEYQNDLIKFSHIGYRDTSIRISNITNGSMEILLTPKVFQLSEVTVLPTKDIELGHKPKDLKVRGYFSAKGLGAEGGSVIKNNAIVSLTDFNFHVIGSTFDTLIFRLNFYYTKNNRPLNKINTTDIYFSITQSDTGHISVPLEDANITVTNTFICTIELVEIIGSNNNDSKFLFSAIPDRRGSTVRKLISMDKWERFKGYSLCFWFNGRE